MRVSPSVLVAVSAIALPLALTAPLYSLLLLDLLLIPFQGQTQIAGVMIDPTDVTLAALAIGILIRGGISLREVRKKVPHFWAWVTLGILMSVAYLTAAKYQQHLTAVHRAAYQVLRFSWKPITFYPLAAVLLSSFKSSRYAMATIVLAGDLCALMALPEGMQGIKAEGPFQTGNSLGAALIVPLVVCAGMLILEASKRWRWYYGLSLLLLARVVLYAGSRGATAGVAVGLAFMCGLMLSRSEGRLRILKMVPLGLAGLLIILAIKPDLLSRPTVRRAMTIRNPMEESTMQWRLENRWGFFWEKALQSPWLGYGTDVDAELAAKGGAKTPHNGYLSLLVSFGFPAAILYISFALLAIYSVLRGFKGSPYLGIQAIGILAAAGLAGILTHNAVESVFTNNDWVNHVYWLLTGIAMVSVRQKDQVPQRHDESVVPLSEPGRIASPLAARDTISKTSPRLQGD